MTGAEFLGGEGAKMQGLSTGNRSVDSLTSTRVGENLADEALYRHYPPVNSSEAGINGTDGGVGVSILDTTNMYTFETLNRKLASRWCSRSSSTSPSFSSRENSNSGGSSSGSSSSCGASKKLLGDNASANTAANSWQKPHQDSPNEGDVCRPACGSKPACSSQLLFLVRHGETDMNKAGRLQGRGVDAHLNAAGMDQAQGLGHFVRNVPFDTVTSSSLCRAHETAMRIAEQNDACLRRAQENSTPPSSTMTTTAERGASPSKAQEENTTQADFCCGDKAQVRVRKVKDLDELSWGELEGKDSKVEPFKGRLASLKQAWDDGIFDRAAKDGENLVEVEARARAAVDAILDQGEELNLVVSHGRTLRILMLSLTGLGMFQMTNMGKIPNCGTYIMEVTRSGPGGTRSYRLLPSCP